MNTLLRLENVNLGWGKETILRELSFTFCRGEKIALIGASGAGKSTLLAEIFRRLGDSAALCPQHTGLVDALSGYHNIFMAQLERRCFWLNLWNLFFPLPSARREIAELAHSFGLEEHLSRPVASLSGGERQRVALARACYRGKDIFLGDEPVSSLDPLQGEKILAQVCSRHETVMIALHNPAMALRYFDRVVALGAGQIRFDQPARSLSAASLTDFYHVP